MNPPTTEPSVLAGLTSVVTAAVGDDAADWDRDGRVPVEVLRELAGKGLLCPEVPTDQGGLGLTSRDAGELTAHTGALCSSLRSVMTSQSMAAGTLMRLGDTRVRSEYLPRLTRGELAGVAFSEPDAGSDLSAMATEIRTDGTSYVVDGEKKWVTAATYADLVVVVGRHDGGAAAVVVPTDTPGVTVTPVESPLGCRAAGHATVRLDGARVPASAMIAGGLPLALLVTAALTSGRMSVAWGCVGILRSCLREAAAHATGRSQFGSALADHQLVGARLADLYTSEQIATRMCEHASTSWDEGSPDAVTATVLAKHVAATKAAAGAASAVQVLASAGAHDGHPVARAYRDAKLMEIIEGSSEICQLMLATKAREAR
ncbi:acyl-CoA dehydrogenase family protein [Spiractinospora alimapuensis]|uniref:acyl-CoA dehydrogenase family protein n=1 Tax=Spiractinospora alimapuensis TaxID=2820884 RepID=UPI001F369D0F|nr:acyl-CoA dehydrogenase family protein [Spiractinospora alimapuensis]QVQ52478.1 acyl-CoA dehydrogenase family protein [Spiractinospora alimapuensis]